MHASMRTVVAAAIAVGLVGAAIAIGLDARNVDTDAEPVTREEIVAAIPQGYGVSYGIGPDIGTPEWVDLTGYAVVRTLGEVARGLNSQPDLPESIGEQACTIAFYGEGEAAGEWVVYAFYGDMVLGVYKSAQYVAGVPVDINRFQSPVRVNGSGGSGWTRGRYDSYALDGKTPVVEVYLDTAVSWAQDGAVLTLSAPNGPYEDLIPLAEEVSKQFSFR